MIETITRVFQAGGIVMWPLLAMSVLALTLVIERAIFWARAHGPGARGRLAELASALRSKDLSRARTLARAGGGLYTGYVAGMLGELGEGRPRPTESMAIEHIELRRPALERFGATLATIVAGAPLLGILGTVLGIIQSFGFFDAQATATDATVVAGGIAEALYTTAFGLVIALVAVFPHAIFRTQTERALARLEMLAAAACDEPA